MFALIRSRPFITTIIRYMFKAKLFYPYQISSGHVGYILKETIFPLMPFITSMCHLLQLRFVIRNESTDIYKKHYASKKGLFLM